MQKLTGIDVLKKPLKEIVKLTNLEFSRNIRNQLPFLGSFLILIFGITGLVQAYLFNFILGMIVTPGVLCMVFWGMLFVNNVHHYWRP